ARLRLEEARTKHDPQLLDEVARRYFFTQAGADAVIQLAAYHLHRGRPPTPALYFQRLLPRPRNDKPEPPTPFQAPPRPPHTPERPGPPPGPRPAHPALPPGPPPRPLEPRPRKIDKLPVSGNSSRDWALSRGAPRRSVQGSGGTPYLEPRWRVQTLVD